MSDPAEPRLQRAPSTGEGAAHGRDEPGGWDGFVASFVEAYFEAHPGFAVASGRHDFDGRLPDWSRDGIAREVARLRAARRQALTWNGRLDAARRFEQANLLSRIDGDLFWLEDAEWPWRNPMFYADSLDPSVYLTRPYAPPAERLGAYVRYARGVPAAAAAVRANLLTPMPPTFAQLGAQSFGGLAAFCADDVPAAFAALLAGQDAAAAAWAEFSPANGAAVAALRDLGSWFEAQLAAGGPHQRTAGTAEPVGTAEPAGAAGTVVQAGTAAQAETPRQPGAAGFALGAERFARMLQATERVEVPLGALAAAGRAELARNLDALRAACAAWRPGRPVAECMALLQQRKPPEGPVAAARRQLAELKRFVDERGLVTIPGGEEARVAESPPHQRWNSAYIDIPGPFDRQLPAIYYIAPPDPTWSAEERAAYLPCEADLLFISAHEVWPGHFLQFMHANRVPSLVGRLFVDYGFAEGWAHYSEEMMWEAGFGGGAPEIHLGQLQNALLRNVRLLVALGLHTDEMTLAEAEAMFREQAFQDPASARQQAARGTFDPGYLNYTLGKLMIRKLREEWTAAGPARGGWREFHDQLLSYGSPPLPLVRTAMLGAADGPPL
jgi:hypothetical protein